MGLIYEKDTKEHKQSEKKKDSWVSPPDVHKGWKTGSKPKKSQGQEDQGRQGEGKGQLRE